MGLATSILACKVACQLIFVSCLRALAVLAVLQLTFLLSVFLPFRQMNMFINCTSLAAI